MRASRLVVAGCGTLAVGLVALLTINGDSGAPSAATIGTAGLIGIGLLLTAAAMLDLARRTDTTQTARRGLIMQSLGLIGFVPGLVLIAYATSLSGYFVGAVVIVVCSASVLTGAMLLSSRAVSLILGMGLIALGAAVVAASKIALQYWISDVENTVYTDAGATVSACGSILAAYWFFVFRGHSGVSALSDRSDPRPNVRSR